MKGKITGAAKVSYDTQINEYKYKYPQANGAQNNGEAAAAEDVKTAENNEVLDTAFSDDAKTQQASANAASANSNDLFTSEEDGAAGDTFTATTSAAAEGENTYTVDANADVETLQAQQETVNAQVEEATNTQVDTQTELERFTDIIARQDERIATLTEEIETLEQSTQNIEQVNAALLKRVERYDTQISKLDTLIQANSGFLGTISNGINSLFGNGVDVNALKAQKATLEAQKAEVEAKIEENNSTIDTNNKQIEGKTFMKETTEGFKAKNEEHAAALEEELAALEEKINNGTATLEEIEAAIKAANEKEGVQASDEDVRKTALTIMAAGANGDKQTEDETNTTQLDELAIQGSNYLNTTNENGERDDSILTDMLVEQGGFTEEEAAQKMEVIEAIATYEEIGITFDVSELATMTAAELNSVTESAIIQEVIKSTSTKVIGGAKAITSKKEMDAQADARDNFIASNNALNGYYNANDVNDFEVQAFLKLSDNMVSNINQGYVYDTSALQQMSSNADALLSTLMTKVSTTEGVGSSEEAQFMQEKTRTEDILGDVEKSLENNADSNDKFSDCKVEFLNLTSGFNNAESDSEKISYIRLMKELGEKGERIQDNPDSQNPYLDGSLWIAA